jgi:hypothetical protein
VCVNKKERGSLALAASEQLELAALAQRDAVRKLNFAWRPLAQKNHDHFSTFFELAQLKRTFALAAEAVFVMKLFSTLA